MCNLTSIAMALETVGISNPSPDMQFEDYLEKHRLEKYGDKKRRTYAKTMRDLAIDMGAEAEIIELGTSEKTILVNKLKSQLDKGYGIALSAFSKKSKKGHIIRLQNTEPEGLRIDDPYGTVSEKIAERESGKHGYKYGETDNRNKTDNESGVGENDLWTWENIQKTTIKYAIIIKPTQK